MDKPSVARSMFRSCGTPGCTKRDHHEGLCSFEEEALVVEGQSSRYASRHAIAEAPGSAEAPSTSAPDDTDHAVPNPAPEKSIIYVMYEPDGKYYEAEVVEAYQTKTNKEWRHKVRWSDTGANHGAGWLDSTLSLANETWTSDEHVLNAESSVVPCEVPMPPQWLSRLPYRCLETKDAEASIVPAEALAALQAAAAEGLELDRSDNLAGYRGVHVETSDGTYRARHGNTYLAGKFGTAEEAALVRARHQRRQVASKGQTTPSKRGSGEGSGHAVDHVLPEKRRRNAPLYGPGQDTQKAQRFSNASAYLSFARSLMRQRESARPGTRVGYRVCTY